MFTLMCLHQSLSLSLHLQTRFGSRSDPNGIQDRTFCQFKKCVHAVERTQSVNTVECPTLPYKSRCARRGKFEFWVLIGSSCNKIDWLTQTLCFDILRNQAKTKDSCANTVQSLLDGIQKIVRRAWSGAKLHNKSSLRPMITTRWKEHFRQVPSLPWADREGGQGVRTPWKSQKYRVS